MVKAMKYRDITKALKAHGCNPKQGKGDHEKWYCQCGKHMTSITQTREVSPGQVRADLSNMQCLPEGWLL